MSADLAAARQNMVDSQVRPSDVTDIFIQDAMRTVDRGACLPPRKRPLAYADIEIEYAPGRWLLRPRDLAKLLNALAPRRGEAALAIFAPYAAAVLEAMGLAVVRSDDGEVPARAGGWPLIVVEGAVARTPQAWLDALAVGGRLGVVERSGVPGRAMVHTRGPQAFGGRAIFDSTPPMLAGYEPAPGFIF